MKALAAALLVSAATAATGAFAAGSMDFVLGKALFERDWVPAPASTDAADGLGPLFGARSCAGCHSGPGLGARFTAMSDGKVSGRGLVLRFGDAEGRPDPVYGHLLQNQAMPGLQAEGRLILTAATDPGSTYDVAAHLDRGAVDPATRFSFRAAPPIAGRAVLERIDAEAVLALADPDDRDGDGISGRARMVEEGGARVLGRYGWKAAMPDLELQVADAFASDLGLSSPRRPLPHGDCTDAEPDCLAAPSGASARLGGHELSAEMVAMVVAYVRGLPGAGAEGGGGRGARHLRRARLRRVPRSRASGRRRHGDGVYGPAPARHGGRRSTTASASRASPPRNGAPRR